MQIAMWDTMKNSNAGSENKAGIAFLERDFDPADQECGHRLRAQCGCDKISLWYRCRSVRDLLK